MSIESKIPLSQLPPIGKFDTSDILDGRLPPMVWDFDLPPSVDSDKIVLNRRAIGAIHAVGALRSSIVAAFQGDQSTFTPGVSGINPDGSAIATKAGVGYKADKSEVELIDDPIIPEDLRDDYGWVTAVLRLNKAEIASSVSDRVREGESNREKAWAKELNLSLKGAYIKASSQNLVQRCSPLLRRIDCGAYVILGGFAVSDLAAGHSTTVPLIWAGLQGFSVATESLSAKYLTGESHILDRKWSIFPSGHQTDRHLGVMALAYSLQLISVKK